jgi:hypothetical protein
VLDAPLPEIANQSSNASGAVDAASPARVEPRPGGESESGEPTDEELDVWNRVVASASTYDGVDLASLGAPVSVVSQVLSGMDYDFTFSDGTVVSVFEQSWTETLEIKDIVKAPSTNGTGQQAGEKPGGFTVLQAGGWSAPGKPTLEDVAVWLDTLHTVGSYQNVDLASLGDPVMVQTQVVSGTKYRYVFESGEVVTVLLTSGTLKVISVEEPKTNQAYINKTVSMMKPDWAPQAAQTAAAPESTEAPTPTSTAAPASTEEPAPTSNTTASMMKPDWTAPAAQTAAAPESTEAPTPTSTQAPASTEAPAPTSTSAPSSTGASTSTEASASTEAHASSPNTTDAASSNASAWRSAGLLQ